MLALGREHLAPHLIDETDLELSRHRAYGRGIVEEAAQWGAARASSHDDYTPSDTTDSGSSSEGSRVDAIFSFSRKDIILVADDNSDVKTYIRSM